MVVLALDCLEGHVPGHSLEPVWVSRLQVSLLLGSLLWLFPEAIAQAPPGFVLVLSTIVAVVGLTEADVISPWICGESLC